MVKNPLCPQVVVSGKLTHQIKNKKVKKSLTLPLPPVSCYRQSAVPQDAKSSSSQRRKCKSSSSPMKAAPLMHSSGLLSYFEVCKSFKSTAKTHDVQANSPS